VVTTQYFDTSALIKCYVDEIGSTWVRERVEQAAGLLVTSSLARVEVACALARRNREGALTPATQEELWQAFSFDVATILRALRVNVDMLRMAEQLAKRHPLRAYDAVHLATALVVNQRLVPRGVPALTFLSADSRLLEFARLEGMAVENPLDHPN